MDLFRGFNCDYIDETTLKEFVQNNNIPSSDKVLIQLFYSNQDLALVRRVRDALSSLLPHSTLIGTSTAGVISDGSYTDDTLQISFSIFDASNTTSVGYTNQAIDEILNDLKKNIITQDTKLLIIFANTFTFNGSLFLETLTKEFPELVIAGGNSGDDYKFEACEVFTNSADGCDVVVAGIESKKLVVKTKCLFNWETIGRSMVVTKSDGNRVYEIDNKTAIEVYRHYLGDEVCDNLLVHGMEFPIIFKHNSVDVARAIVSYEDDGSIIVAGNVPQGAAVKFGYANLEHIENLNTEMLIQEFKHKKEAIYIYSCASRRRVLGTFLNNELLNINNIATTAGFITYGEFYHDTKSSSNTLLNLTTTYVSLREGEINEPLRFFNLPAYKDERAVFFKALTNLLARTSEELDENILYLKQFRNSVEEASLISASDASGTITYVNKNFEKVSGFTTAELVGNSHKLVRHPEQKSEVYVDMWSTIQSGKIWKGIIKNRAKNGNSYYVLSEIAPFFNKHGKLIEYIAIHRDVTELEEYKNLLKSELGEANRSLQDKIHYVKQYENTIDLTLAIFKTDVDKRITFANEKLCEISGYSLDELVGNKVTMLRKEIYHEADKMKKIDDDVANKKTVNIVLNNMTKENKRYITNTLIYPILDLNAQVVEHLYAMHDITEVIELNEEIINTQKEVVFTMGAIGETRSKETGLHVKRVAEYSYLLAKHYGLDEEVANLLREASPMHDIGKVGIPDNVLNKPGKLTVEEFEIMKTHAQLGYEMLKHSKKDILQASAVVAHSHHEKWDGSGYPTGLKGEEINIFGRITAIADVFDALGHDRVYKKAWVLEDILELFREERGKHFDPRLVDIFFENLDEFLKVQKNLGDNT